MPPRGEGCDCRLTCGRKHNPGQCPNAITHARLVKQYHPNQEFLRGLCAACYSYYDEKGCGTPALCPA